jgi:hypothetical protein
MIDSAAPAQVEGWVKRPLTADELVTVSSVHDLSDAQRDVFEALARRHRLAALLYLRGVVEGLTHSEATAIVDIAAGFR